MGVNVQLNSGLRMSRWISRLLVTAVALCGVGETRLQSSKIVFPSTQIGPLDNPFNNPRSTINNPLDNPFGRLDSIHSSKLSYVSKVKFPEQEILKIPTRGEFDSLVHFPAKSDVEDPIGNKMIGGKKDTTENKDQKEENQTEQVWNKKKRPKNNILQENEKRNFSPPALQNIWLKSPMSLPK